MRTQLARRDDHDEARAALPDTPGNDGSNRVIVYDRGPSYRQVERALRDINLEAISGLQQGKGSSRANLTTARMNIVNETVPGALAQCESLSPSLPTLLLTREISFENRVSAARAGVDGLLRNPVSAEELVGWLNHFGRQGSNTKASILLIDDDDLVAAVYAAKLTEAGMSVSCATDARSAFECLEAEEFDLVLLDIQMPGVDGLEFARVIRQSIKNLSLPIIFLSSEKDQTRQLEARKFGGDDFIMKPVSPERLLSLIQIRLERAQDLRGLMERDSLTGLLNHATFKSRLDHELERCRRTGAEVCVALIDIDHFKSVNDTHGHMVGDRVISALANLLRGTLRKIDIIGRYGGEEFGVIMLDTPENGAQRVIDRIRTMFTQINFEAGGRSFSSSFSGGICSSRTTLDGSTIITLADAALYRAKDAGRNTVMVRQNAEVEDGLQRKA